MYIKDIVQRHCDRFGIDDDSLKNDCIDFVKNNIDKCNLNLNIKSYICILVSSFFVSKIRNLKIDKLYDK